MNCQLPIFNFQFASRWRLLAPAVAFLALCVTGCPGRVAKCPTTMLEQAALVDQYNQNAQAVDRLWARAKVSVTVQQKPGALTTSWPTLGLSPNGVLMLGKNPGDRTGAGDFVLIGNEAGRPLFAMGNSLADGVYYVWLNMGDKGGAWYGKTDRAGAPGTEELLIDPLGLMSLLGVVELPSDFSKLPAVAMTMSQAKPCSYVLTYIDRQPITNRILFKREVYFNWQADPKGNLAPARPYRVDFISPDGRPVMTASLGAYKSFPGGAGGRSVMIPTDITLEQIAWPGRFNPLRSLHVVLTEVKLNAALDEIGADPAGTAVFWDSLPQTLRGQAVDIDRAATQPAQEKGPAK